VGGVPKGGTGGNGGLCTGLYGGGGGGGFRSAGQNCVRGGSGGGAFPDLTGAEVGGGVTDGIGGGGEGFWGIDGKDGVGGGGGYSGGSGGGGINSNAGISGGGGSFDGGRNQILMAGIRSGNGEVVITFIFAGMPGTANCLGKSVSALASQNRGLSHAAEALGYASVQALQDAISAYCADVPPS
jgi:hypothetical protein